jgi:hypothetical protein
MIMVFSLTRKLGAPSQLPDTRHPRESRLRPAGLAPPASAVRRSKLAEEATQRPYGTSGAAAQVLHVIGVFGFGVIHCLPPGGRGQTKQKPPRAPFALLGGFGAPEHVRRCGPSNLLTRARASLLDYHSPLADCKLIKLTANPRQARGHSKRL